MTAFLGRVSARSCVVGEGRERPGLVSRAGVGGVEGFVPGHDIVGNGRGGNTSRRICLHALCIPGSVPCHAAVMLPGLYE